MAALPPICDFGWKAVDFSLPGVDGGTHTLADISGPNGTLIMFICNHCPYVKAIADKIASDAADLRALGIGVAAICVNDAASYPADSFANMKLFAEQSGFTFPYLWDESQTVARAYDAICTPDFFGFNAAGALQYRGRLDESKATPIPNAKRELVEAMRQVAETSQGPREQIAAMGCSIKWKRAA
jgi:peroxiredoxin